MALEAVSRHQDFSSHITYASDADVNKTETYAIHSTGTIMAWFSSFTPPIVHPFSLVLFIILYCGNGVIADAAISTNLWAVKVRGSRQEAEELAHKRGFTYEEHVSFILVKASLLSPCSMDFLFGLSS